MRRAIYIISLLLALFLNSCDNGDIDALRQEVEELKETVEQLEQDQQVEEPAEVTPEPVIEEVVEPEVEPEPVIEEEPEPIPEPLPPAWEPTPLTIYFFPIGIEPADGLWVKIYICSSVDDYDYKSVATLSSLTIYNRDHDPDAYRIMGGYE